MNLTFLTLGFMSLSILKFDTQDNVVFKDCEWKQNVDLETFQPIGEIGLWRDSNTTIWIKSKTPLKTVRLNNFPYWYKVKKISSKHFQIKCKKFPEYWNNEDVIQVVVKK